MNPNQSELENVANDKPIIRKIKRKIKRNLLIVPSVPLQKANDASIPDQGSNDANVPTVTTSVEPEKVKISEQKVINKGTGAGGAKTNENGKKLEERVRDFYTSKCSVLKVLEKNKNKYKVEEVSIDGRIFNRAPETAFRNWDILNGFSKDNEDYKNRGLHGAKNPDDALIDMVDKTIYWAESKVQEVGGSKCEVLQTYNHKLRNLRERYPEYTINYIYVLDRNFKKLCPKEISYMIEDNIKIVWGDDENFEESLMSVIA